jgi:hypothetical protein
MKNGRVTCCSRRINTVGLPGSAVLLIGLLAVLFSSCSLSSSRTAGVGGVPDEGAPSPSWWEGRDLDEATQELADGLVVQGGLQGVPLLITMHDLYDAETGLSLPLAGLLRGKLTTAMKRRGVRVLLDGADEERFMILQGTWQRERGDLAIHLRITRLGPFGPEAVASASQKVDLDRIDAAALTPDRESWARYLVRKLEENTTFRGVHRVYMGDFNVRTDTCSPELGPYLTGWLRPAMAESRMFVPLDPQQELKGLSIAALRSRGTRAIRPDLAQVPLKTGLTADLLEADGELRGEAWRHRQKIEVRAAIIGPEGEQMTAASADIPVGLFPQELLRPRPVTPSPFPSSVSPVSGGVSKDGLVLELTTTRGGDRAVFRQGERIRFVIRLNRSAWVYLFNLDPAGNATLLYPVDARGKLARGGQCGSLPRPGTPLILPEDGCSYDLVVTAPYGKDRVWAVAAESPLSIPPDLRGEWRRTDVLLDRLRRQGLSAGGGYAEAEIVAATVP